MSSQLAEDEFPNQLSSVDVRLAEELRHRNTLWRSNYHEASIYIEEGLNNDKFENHPRKRATLAATNEINGCLPGVNNATSTSDNSQISPLIPDCDVKKPSLFRPQAKHVPASLLGGQYTTIETYILVHNRYFYQLDLAASVVLLLLALVEPPAVEGYQLNAPIHAAIEMFALGIIAIELLLKFRWMGPRRFFLHGRTATKLVVLLIMIVEAIVIFLRHSSHARFSRALRPIFLIDNHYCHGIRRAIRQIFQSLPPIIDMFTLALFFMFVFSILGFYLFAADNPYLSDMPTTVGNLLILATTANLPDIMTPSYAVSRWSTIYFVLFVIIHLFLLTNLTMAAVYESFTSREKEKFHKLLLHRRKACQEAFKLLVSRRQPNRIQYRQFMGLMRYLNRKCSMFDAYLIFKALDTDKNGSISLEEFYQIYDFIDLEWKLIFPEPNWYDSCYKLSDTFKNTLSIIKRVTSHKYFDWTIDSLIAAAAFLQFVEATAFEFSMPTIKSAFIDANNLKPDSISTTIFIVTFTAEMILRMLALGLKEFWACRWNRFDSVILLVAISGLLNGYIGGVAFGWVIVLRILRLMRLFEFKRRYRDVWQTLVYILLKRFVSMTCVVMILYYFFAIVGMELLSDYDLRDCCKNTSLESQFKFDTAKDGARYYLNDFSDMVASYLTLFSMSSNTCWLITMNAFAIMTGSNWIRLFFGIYYICSIIVMNIVIAFILESFLFRIHYRSKMGKNCDDANLFTVRVTLSSSEVDFLCKNMDNSSSQFDKNFHRMIETVTREKLITLEEKISLLCKDADGKSVANKAYKIGSPSSMSNPCYDKASSPSTPQNDTERQNRPSMKRPSYGPGTILSSDKRWYLIYQAEQIRNKFSYTMKMYAEEVEEWLSEAERADQDGMSTMISRNQLRAEHVAMARLVRRNIANANEQLDHLINWPRMRSYSTSGGVIAKGRPGAE